MFSKDELADLLNSGKSVADISRESGVSYSALYHRIRAYGIKVDTPKQRISREILEKLYCEEHLPISEIMKILRVNESALYEYIRKYELSRPRIKQMSEDDAEFAVSAYSEGNKTLRQIALELHTSTPKVADALRKRGLIVNGSESHKIKTDYRLPDTLRKFYVEQGLSSRDIAKRSGVTKGTVLRWLKEAGIEIRDIDVAKKMSFRNGRRSRENSSNWKGGRIRSPQGYIFLRMPGHPLADERGYVKEHILVATGGDPGVLGSDKLVHHVDLDKTNNVPENLKILTKREHQLAHYELECLAAELVKSGDIVFEDGHYRFSEAFTNTRSKVDIVDLS